MGPRSFHQPVREGEDIPGGVLNGVRCGRPGVVRVAAEEGEQVLDDRVAMAVIVVFVVVVVPVVLVRVRVRVRV